MVLCEMYHARQSPRPVPIKSLQKSSFIGRISQYFPAREVCDWSVLTKLSLCMGLVPFFPCPPNKFISYPKKCIPFPNKFIPYPNKLIPYPNKFILYPNKFLIANDFFPVPIRAGGLGLARQVRPSVRSEDRYCTFQ